MTAVTVLGIGLLSLAAGSGWLIRSSDPAEHEVGRVTALQSTVEQVRAIPFESLRAGSAMHGAFEVSWTLEERTPSSVLIRFVVEGRTPQGEGEGMRRFTPTRSTDTLDYHRNGP